MQLAEPVLDRRPGERDAVARSERADRPRLLGLARLDVLGLVEHDPVPLDRLERLAVAQRERVRRHHEVVRARGARERLPLEPLAAIVDVHPQARREPLGLPLPVAGHRHRADQQRRAHGLAGSTAAVPGTPVRRLLALGQQQRERLRGLSKPHVVRQARAQPEAREEREPRESALLVGTQLTLERTGRLHPLEPRGRRRRAAALRASPRRRSRPRATAPRGPPAPTPSPSRSSSPADARPRTRLPLKNRSAISTSSARSAIQRPRALTSGSFSSASASSSDSDSVVSPTATCHSYAHSPSIPNSPGALPPLLLGVGTQLDPQPLTPPRRGEDREATLLERGHCLAQEAVGLLGGQLDAGRRGLVQRRLEVRPQRQRMPEPPEQPLLRVLEHVAERRQALAARPHLLGRHEHARVVLGLQQDLDAPPIFFFEVRRRMSVCGRQLRQHAIAILASLLALAVARWHQPEASPEHALRAVPLARRPPLVELLSERGELPRVAVDDGVAGDERSQPGSHGAARQRLVYARRCDRRAARVRTRRRPRRAGRRAPRRARRPSSEREGSARSSGGMQRASSATRAASPPSSVTGNQRATHCSPRGPARAAGARAPPVRAPA